MKHIIKLSFVLLALLFSACNEINEEELVLVNVGFSTSKVSSIGDFVEGPDNVLPMISIPYTNGSGQEITVTTDGYTNSEGGAALPSGLSFDSERVYTVGNAEQGVLLIEFDEGCYIEENLEATENYSYELNFGISTSSRTWDIVYTVTIAKSSVVNTDMQIVSATLDAKIMQGVDIREDEVSGNQYMTIVYKNAGGKRYGFTFADDTGTEQLQLAVDGTNSFFLSSNSIENTLQIPIDGIYTGTASTVALTINALEIQSDEEALVADPIEADFPMVDIPTYTPANFGYTVTVGGSGSYVINTDLTYCYALISYTNGEDRAITVNAKIRYKDGVDLSYQNLYLCTVGSDGNSTDNRGDDYTFSYTATRTDGTITIPIRGYYGSTGEVYIDVQISGAQISDMQADYVTTNSNSFKFSVK